MNVSGNARSIASKEKIKDAFLEILTCKDISKMSVHEICEKAKVNRSTFYAHYLDINDLMLHVEIDIAAPLSVYNKSAYQITSKDSLLQLVEYFRKHQTFYRIFFTNSSESLLMQESSEFLQKHMIEPYLAQSEQYSQDEYDYQFEFCKRGFIGVICRWLEKDCLEQNEVIAGFLEKVLSKCLS